MELTTKDVLTQYLMGIPQETCSDTLLILKLTCDQIYLRMKKTYKTFDFIIFLNSVEALTCFLHQLTLQPIHLTVICSILSTARLIYKASVNHEQSFRIHELIDKITSYMSNNGIENWIEIRGGWQNIAHF